jgi:hypothetical protein
MAKTPASAVKPLPKSPTSRTLKFTQKMANASTAEDAPLSQQPAVRKRLGAKPSKI